MQRITVANQLLPISEIPPRTEVVMVAHSKARLGVPTEGVQGALLYATHDNAWRFRCAPPHRAVAPGGHPRTMLTRHGAWQNESCTGLAQIVGQL